MNNGDPLQYAADMILIQEEPRGPSMLIEIPVTTDGLQKIKLPDVQQLRSQEGQTIIIKALRLISEKVLVGPITVTGPNAPLAELQKMAITIYSQGWEKGQNIPLLSLNDMADGDSTAATTIPYRNRTTKFANWRNVDWSGQSFIQLANGTVTANTPYAIILECEYLKLDAKGVPINGAS